MQGKVLFINHPERECGVHQFGESTFSAIRASSLFQFIYCECSSHLALKEQVGLHQPVAVIYNYYGSTMPWLHPGITRKMRFPQIGIMHECTQERVNSANRTLFDFHIAPDPTLLLTNPIVFKTGRLIPTYRGEMEKPGELTVGSFGFGTRGKGYPEIIEAVQKEFDQALIRFNIPFARFGDAEGEGARAYAEACRRLISKPGIRLIVTHDFLDQEQVLEFLAANTINCFFYEENKNRGISSVIDLALAVDRPIAITQSNMFRHVTSTDPSICIEKNSLAHIIQNGVGPLLPYKKEWTAENLRWDYERIVTGAMQNFKKQSLLKSQFFALVEKLPGQRYFRKMKGFARRSLNRDKLMLAGKASARKEAYGHYQVSAEGLLFEDPIFNRILDNRARFEYGEVIKLLCVLCPDEMSRKIPEANVQQAFVFEAVRNLSRQFPHPRILSVGCYEDTAYLSLKKLRFNIDGIDPILNYDLSTFLSKPGIMDQKYDIIFSTSVIEHVREDDRFIREMESLLNPGGFIILTCDFKKDYKPGERIPRVDFRFYTAKDLEERLPQALRYSQIFGSAKWDYEKADFSFENIAYTFASFVARKKIN